MQYILRKSTKSPDNMKGSFTAEAVFSWVSKHADRHVKLEK